MLSLRWKSHIQLWGTWFNMYAFFPLLPSFFAHNSFVAYLDHFTGFEFFRVDIIFQQFLDFILYLFGYDSNTSALLPWLFLTIPSITVCSSCFYLFKIWTPSVYVCLCNFFFLNGPAWNDLIPYHLLIHFFRRRWRIASFLWCSIE